jgi:hypothetical protein
MLPLIAIGGAISAVASVFKGASWLSDKLSSSSSSTSAASAVNPAAKTDAKFAPFEAALKAQVAGQTLPGSSAGATAATSLTSSSAVPLTHGTDYDSLARMQAGMAAYSQIGEHRGNHPGAATPPGAVDDKPIMQ